MNDVGISNAPEQVEVPLCAPEAVAVVVFVGGTAVSIQRNLPNHLLRAGHVTVTAVHIADAPPP